MSSNTSFCFPHSYAGTHIEQYNAVIRKKVESAGYKLIELYDNHVPYDAVDGIHPTAAGMNTLAALMLRKMCDSEGAAFLNCKSEHDFITAEEYTGGSRRVCRKCGMEQHSGFYPPQELLNPDTSLFSAKGVILQFQISDGDCPIPHYEYRKGELKGYNRINGSRDGRIHILETEQHLFVILEYIEEIVLSQKLKTDGVFSEQSAIDIRRRLAAVLHYIHTFSPPYIYRDMKPANVMLTKSGEIKLIDFGIAMIYRPDSDNDPDHMGTKGYAAPEQYGGQGTIDPRADIYGLGMTLYHMLTGIAPGEPPYNTPPIRQVNPAVSAGIEYIVNKCISPRREDRYQDCMELMKDLNNVQNLPPKKGFFGNLFGRKKKFVMRQQQ